MIRSRTEEEKLRRGRVRLEFRCWSKVSTDGSEERTVKCLELVASAEGMLRW